MIAMSIRIGDEKCQDVIIYTRSHYKYDELAIKNILD